MKRNIVMSLLHNVTSEHALYYKERNFFDYLPFFKAY